MSVDRVPDPRHQLGLQGELLAEKHLKRLKMKTLARRFLCPVGELDLVMRDGKTIVFVEVKTQTEDEWIDPEQRVTPTKQRRLVRAAAWLVNRRGWTDAPLRFDVVTVVQRRDGTSDITHIPDAFVPKRWSPG